MRILQIHNKYLEKGGEDTVVANERQLLEANGDIVALCTFDNQDLEGLSTPKLLFKTLFNRKSYQKVLGEIKVFQPDVIHIHNIYYDASSAIFWAIKKSKIPAVMTIHNYRLGCIQGLLFRENAICQLCLERKSSYFGLKYRCFKDSFIKSLQLTLINKFNQWTIRYINPVTQYIFLAEFTKNLLSPILSLKNSQGIIKSNYVHDFGYTPRSERDDTYLFVGRLNEQKGLKVLIEAFKKNKKRLDIIGSGPLDAFVKAAAQSHPNIHYLGYANGAFIIEKLKKIKALIVPSLTYEGQPMTILEAFSTGTPVLAANTKNLDTLINPSINGFLFDATHIDAINKAIDDFENTHTSSMYIQARKTYEKNFSPMGNYKQLMAIYKHAISISDFSFRISDDAKGLKPDIRNLKSEIEKKSLFHVNYAITDYEKATKVIINNALQKNSFGVSALAVHGLIESYKDTVLRDKVNKIDMVVPDGQPVRWALNAIHKTQLKDRVCGPILTQWVLEHCNQHGLKIYLYGSTQATLDKFSRFINEKYPNISICGIHTDRFREATPEEDSQDIDKINQSGANIVLVGRGCPRQEKWVSDHLGKINSVMMAVGAAFDFHAGNIKLSPKWMQDNGLEWLFRLIQEPKRLWKRYLFTNTHFIYLFLSNYLRSLVFTRETD